MDPAMNNVVSPLRFFSLVRLHSPFMLLALGAAGVAAILMLVGAPSRGAEAVMPLALVQMFAASSGFVVSARRGHLDLLLTSGSSRVVVAVTHFALSMAPGILVWLAVGVVEMIVARTLWPKALASGTVVAFGVISALGWAMTARLPRLSGAIAWLLAMAVWSAGWIDFAAVRVFDDGAVGYAGSAIIVAICPFTLLGRELAGREVAVVVPAIALAATLAALAIVWVVRMDVPLESSQ